MKKPTISVIIPIYNVEKYLCRCIDSILVQTFTDFELLLIDDGSKDKSGEICDEYMVKDERVRVFHKVNGGVSSARNWGLDNAKGEWVIFVDSDDWVKPSYLEIFLSGLSYDAKLVVCSNNSGKGTSTDYINGMLFDKIPWTMMMKLFKAEVLRNTKALNVTRDINLGEDLIANIIVANNINEVSYINNDGYIYYENDSSITKNRTWSLEYEIKFLSYVNQVLKDYDEYSVGYWLLCLRTVKNLLLNGVKVSRSHCLYKFLVDNRCEIPLGIGDKLVLRCPFPQITQLMLQVITKFKGIKKRFC